MTSTLIDINKSLTCKGSVLNPFPVEATLHQNAYVGNAEQKERIVSVLADSANEGEGGCNESIR